MATTTQFLAKSRAPSWIKGGIAGLIAGLVFAMWAMVVGAFTPGSNLLAPPQGIAQSLGIGSPGHDFQAVPLILGLIFIAIVGALRLRRATTVIVGMIYGLAVYAAMYWVVLRGLLAGNSGSFLSANPEWSWVVAHLMFGVALGALLAIGPLSRRTEPD
jgi:hypothetical protein